MNVYPLSVFFSFRFFIESMTTMPFLVSYFVEHGQYLYDKPVDALKAKLIQLIITIAVLLYNGMSAFQYCEVTFGTVNYTILESLYVVMVTLSTVGYGGSRIVMMLLIVISLAVLPSLLADSLSTLRKRQDGGGSVSKGTMPFILIVGTFTPEQANDILDGFLNREHIETHLNIVFLDINRPTEELKLMERNSMWGHRVQFLHGSVLNEKTLQRAQARYAKAIITMSDNNTPEPAKEDERNTVRLWSLYCYTTTYSVPIYTYNLYPSTAIYQKVAKEIICLREFKQYLLAMNCRCRGASTLLTNLLHQREPRNKYDEPWQAQYGKWFIYIIRRILFKEFQVILFAIKLSNEDEDDHIILNPGKKYLIKSQDLCVYMAESTREINDIKKMANFCISRLPSSKHALLTGNRALVSRMGMTNTTSDGQLVEDNSLPLCYLLQEPATLDDLVIDSADGMDGHILVCLHRRVINIFKFIYNLRSPYMKPNDLQDIILLCATLPNKKTFDLIKQFPRGNCRHPDDLLRAGVKRAKQVVVMSEKENLDQYERNSDSPAV
ncbi:hypothetical protein CLU79DRAFT_806279 [Phycomyces nitens]|nr:hypothetical protein CLU79DRAFT_806279 [Phycomyces nitens]